MKKIALWLCAVSLSCGLWLCPAEAQETLPLTNWLGEMMLEWSPPRLHPREDEMKLRARYRDIAANVARVALDPSEPPMYRDADEKVARARTALLILDLAFQESGFREDVDNGTCKPPECDDGFAWTLWQLHPGRGLALDGTGWKYSLDGHRSAALVKDRALTVRIVLHMARRHIGAWTTARAAQAHATMWWGRRPFRG